MADLNSIAEELSSLTVMQAADLVKMLEQKWGVSAAAPVAVAAGPAAGGGGAAPAHGAAGGRASRPGGGRGRRGRRQAGRGEDRVHPRPQRGGREEDQRHQGSSRD